MPTDDELKDDQLINESYSKRPDIFWKWAGLFALFIFGIWFIQWSVQSAVQEKIRDNPFNNVTNREFSVFLWENPQYFRAHSDFKTGYLPAFQYLDKQVTVEPELAEQIVIVNPEILFLYHTWNRLLGEYWIPTKIDPQEFKKFLEYDEQWRPFYWSDAPESYVALVESLDRESGNIADKLPLPVRKSFQGWKNYIQNGDAINELQPSYKMVYAFVQKYPHYGRSYWVNIFSEGYLVNLEKNRFSDQKISRQELSAMLRVALYNSSR